MALPEAGGCARHLFGDGSHRSTLQVGDSQVFFPNILRAFSRLPWVII